MRKKVLNANQVLFSIIIPTFNVKKYILKCLASILSNRDKGYETVVVDNGSTDGTIEAIKKKFSKDLARIKIVPLDRNYGPARARNKGAKKARGEFLGFLDSDTEVSPEWLSEGRRCLTSHPRIGAVQCKLLWLKDKKRIDYVGEYLGSLGFLVPVARHFELDKGQYDLEFPILAAKSAGMFIRKDVFEKIGGFDEDYFIFLEETDLGWRCWLTGHEVVFCPRSVVYHYFSASKEVFDPEFNNYLVRFHGTKNYILTLYKNLSVKNLLKILPFHIFLWLALSLYLTLRGNFRSALHIIQGLFWNLRNLGKNTGKRIRVQKNRVLSDDYLFDQRGLMKNRGLFFHLERFLKSQREETSFRNQ